MSAETAFKYRLIQIPACGDQSLEVELNEFLATHAILDVRQEFVSHDANSHWCYSIRWRDGGISQKKDRKGIARVDYKEILEPADFAIFAKLRDFRKDLAKKEELPAYAIFTNEQLAEMARMRPESLTAIRKIQGVGESRAKKYGKTFLEFLVVQIQELESSG